MTTEERAQLRKSIDEAVRCLLFGDDIESMSIWCDSEGQFVGEPVEEECRAAWAAYAKARGIEE